MRKFIISAVVAVVAAVSFAAPSQAGYYGYGHNKHYGYKSHGYKSHGYKHYGYKKHFKKHYGGHYGYKKHYGHKSFSFSYGYY
jgi:hypothetical protein